MANALDGIRVLDFSRMYGGPFGTMLLAELGADVIKVELVEVGDAVRTLPPMTEGMESYIFVILNRGKRSITLNLNSEEGRRICRELVARCDVLVENFTPGVMEKLGLGYEELKTANPRLIYTSISGFGHTGPQRDRVAFDTVVQAMGGLISVNGHRNAPPTKVAPAIADFLGGMYGIISIQAALQHRQRTNEGQFIDVSMQDCIWAMIAIQFLPGYVLTGQEPQKLGNRQIECTPFSIYPTKDGNVVIAVVTVGQWQRFLEVIGREDLKNVPEYTTQNTRIRYADEMDDMVAQWTKEKTVNEVLSLLTAADLPCAAVPTFSQVANDEQLAYRNMQLEVEQIISGKLKVPGSPFKMSRTPGDAGRAAPFLGQHNFEVYSELLGYDAETIDRLQSQGII